MAEILIIALLIVIVAAAFYQIRIIKRVNTKLIKLMEPERDIRKIAKKNRDEAWQHYRQSEYYAQLLLALAPSAPLPPLRSWAASPDLLVTLFYTARSANPRTIVDLGSGASTLVLAKAAPAAKIISIDNSAEYAMKTEEMLKEHGVTNVDIRVAPLTPLANGIHWYHPDAWNSLRDIDLLFIDGPPGSKDDTARHPAFTELASQLSPHATVIIDDVHRAGEKEMAHLFAKALPTHTLLILDHEKGTAILQPTKG